MNKALCLILECLRAIKDYLTKHETTCGGNQIDDANYEGAIAWVIGRPNTLVPYELIDNRDPLNPVVVASGADFGQFIASMEALGYTEWSFGETHYFCPCPPGLVVEGDYFVTADGNTISKPPCTPLAELEGVPEKANAEPILAIATHDKCTYGKMCEMVTAQNQTNVLLQKLIDCSCGPCDTEVEPPAATIRCQSYGSFGSSSLVSRLSTPDLYHDPALPGDPGSPDYSCLNHYPIDLVAYDVQITTDAGATWSQAPIVASGPVVVDTWTSAADVSAAPATDMADWLNAIPEVFASGVIFSGLNSGWSVDKPADTEVRVLYGFIYNSDGDPVCRLDPFHRQWTDDFYVMASDGDAAWLGNSEANNTQWLTQAPTPADYTAAASTHDVTSVGLVDVENCEAI